MLWPCLYHARISVAHACLSCTPGFVIGGRTLCRGQLCLDLKIFCHDIISLYPSQLCRDIELLYHDMISPCLGQLYRDLITLSRDKISSQPSQLCRHIELLCRNTKSLPLATLYRDIKIFFCERKLLAWPTLSRLKNTLSR